MDRVCSRPYLWHAPIVFTARYAHVKFRFTCMYMNVCSIRANGDLIALTNLKADVLTRYFAYWASRTMPVNILWLLFESQFFDIDTRSTQLIYTHKLVRLLMHIMELNWLFKSFYFAIKANVQPFGIQVQTYLFNLMKSMY